MTNKLETERERGRERGRKWVSGGKMGDKIKSNKKKGQQKTKKKGKRKKMIIKVAPTPGDATRRHPTPPSDARPTAPGEFIPSEREIELERGKERKHAEWTLSNKKYNEEGREGRLRRRWRQG